MKNKVIIVSGGMDSITLLHLQKNFIKLALGFNYGQKHSKELLFAKENCEKLEIRFIEIDLTGIAKYFKSNLLKGGGEIPEGHYEDKVMKKTVVPFRNGIMLSIACGIAESYECDIVLIGNHAGDHTIYPDCRYEFIDNMAKAMNLGTYRNIKLDAPFTLMTKREIALNGERLKVDWNKTWSCYKGGDVHCGKCGTCVERKEALKGFDTTIYEGIDNAKSRR